jgi:AcrR family transcriptional regulator
MPRRKRNNGLPDERLEEIKTAAVKWFYRRGYEGTDLRLIARDVDLHPSSFYNYIKSKEELLYLIMKDGLVLVQEGLDHALADVTDPVDRLRSAIRWHVLHHARRRYVGWTSQTEFRALKGRFRANILALRDEYEAKWISLLEEGIESGHIQPLDTRVVAYGILTMGQAVSRWFNPRGRMTAEQVADIYAGLLLNGLLQARPEGAAKASGARRNSRATKARGLSTLS